jgi:hypothetical protein
MPTAFQDVALQIVQNTQTLGDLANTRYPSPQSVADKIASSYDNNSISTYVFPGDIPKHHFSIYEYSITGVTARQLQQIYVLPLPRTLTDSKSINYNDGFNIIGSIGALVAAGGNLAGGVKGGVVATAGQFLLQSVQGAGQAAIKTLSGGGLSLNNLNMVTLDIPQFQRFSLDFILAPKTKKESDELNMIIFNLKKYSHPEGSWEAFGVKLVLKFPRIYLMAFNPSPKYLYKFKPCVIENITINYAPSGTAFYKVDGESVPEAVHMHLQCKELEVWIQENFKSSMQQPTSNPFDSISYSGMYGFQNK